MRAERTNHVSVARETRAPPAQDGFLLPEVKKVADGRHFCNESWGYANVAGSPGSQTPSLREIKAFGSEFALPKCATGSVDTGFRWYVRSAVAENSPDRNSKDTMSCIAAKQNRAPPRTTFLAGTS